MPEKKIKAVLFDLGETLFNFGQINTKSLFQEGARLSYDFLRSKDQPVGNFHFYCWRNLIAIRLRCWLSNITGKDFDALTLLKKLHIPKGFELDEQQWRHLAWLWYEPLSRVCRPEADIKKTLTKLADSGIKLGIVSNTFINASTLDKQLELFGILDFFDFRLYSYEVDFRKPDVRIFKLAAEKAEEKLRNIMYVGDRLDKDVEPSLKLGMTAVLKDAYTNQGKKVPQGAYRIKNLSELPCIIEKINTN